MPLSVTDFRKQIHQFSVLLVIKRSFVAIRINKIDPALSTLAWSPSGLVRFLRLLVELIRNLLPPFRYPFARSCQSFSNLLQ